jgi:hypothetical protein
MLKGHAFTGDVYSNMIHVTKDPSMLLGNVTFCPGSVQVHEQTGTHTHGRWILIFFKGQGGYVIRTVSPKRFGRETRRGSNLGRRIGMVAEEGSVITTFAAAFGETKWLEEVTDEEYAKVKDN